MQKAQAPLSITALAALINKKFGVGTLVKARDAIGLNKPRISTGCFALDLVLGGGYPEGAIELLEGERTSAKSWNLMCRAREFLKKYPEGVFILVNAEGTNDPRFLDMLGVDLDRTFILMPDSGEQAWDAAIEVATLAHKVYIGVDSLDLLVPMAELDKDVGDALYAPAAKMNNKGFRKLISVMKSDITNASQRVTVCVITQLRQNIGVTFGDPMQSVGGKGKAFAAMQIIRYKRVRYVRAELDAGVAKESTKETAKLDSIAHALEIEFEVMKSKGAGEGERGRFTLYKENHDGFRRGDIDNVTALIPYLIRYGILDKAGAWLTFSDGTQFQGEEKVAEFLRAQPEWLEEMQKQARDIHAERYAMQPDPATTSLPAPVESIPTATKPVRKLPKRGK